MKFELLSEITKIVMGQSPPSSSYNLQGQGLPFFQGKADFGDRYPRARVFCTKPQKIAEAGDILISVRAPVGPTNINPAKSCIGRGLAALRCSRRISRNYLLYFLRFYEPKLAHVSTGSTFDAVSKDDLENILVPLPSPDEQKHIASILEKADRLRRLRRYALEVSSTYLQSVFLKMFGDPAINPMGWKTEPLGDRIDFLTSGSRGWAQYYSNKGAIFLRIQNIGLNQLLLDDLAYVQVPNTAEGRRTRVIGGDLLLSITADLGRTAVIPENFPEAYINQHLALLRLRDLNPVFIAGLINTPGGKAQISRLDREGVKSGLNFDDVRGLQIIVPPSTQQEKFAQIVQKYERLRSQQKEAERQAEHLFQTLLHQAFQGELTSDLVEVAVPSMAISELQGNGHVGTLEDIDLAAYQLALPLE